MNDYTSVLSGSLMDYTEWVIKQTNIPPGAPTDLRGILYNKLVARLKELHSGYDVRQALKPEHIIVSFTPKGHVGSLSFIKERISYNSDFRNRILDGLEEASLNIDVTDYHDMLSYELGKVIMDLKKSLSYGRQQTTG